MMGATFDDIVEQATLRTTTVPLCLRGDLLARQEELRRAFDRAQARDALTNDDDQAPAIAAELVEVENEIEASQVPFRVTSIGSRKWRDLVAEHPPRPGDKSDHNPETFYPAAMVACLVDPPGITLEGVRRLEERVGVGTLEELYAAISRVNVQDNRRLGKSRAASVLAPASDPSSTTAAPEASPAQSSLDEL